MTPAEEHSSIRLAEALGQIPGVPPAMIAKAREGFYHDYLSPLAFPQMQLVHDLRVLAAQPTTGPGAARLLAELQRRVIDGDFDASSTEAAEWAASPEGQQAFRELTGETS